MGVKIGFKPYNDDYRWRKEVLSCILMCIVVVGLRSKPLCNNEYVTPKNS